MTRRASRSDSRPSVLGGFRQESAASRGPCRPARYRSGRDGGSPLASEVLPLQLGQGGEVPFHDL
jgi:hypothetical protein